MRRFPSLLPAISAVAAALLALAPAPAAVRAQSAVDAGAGAAPAPGDRVFPFLGVRAGAPQRLSVTAGIGLNLDPAADPGRPSREILAAVAPGLGAERASLTFVYSTGRFGGGIAGGATALRTVTHPWNAPANATYVGADIAVLPIIAIGPRLGLLRRVSAPTGDRAWLWTLDFGFGF
jgi:hypothetical protein